MKPTRIAALSVVVSGLLAVPATAMASTSGSPAVPAISVTVAVRCLPRPVPQAKGAVGAVTIVPSPAVYVSARPGFPIRVFCCGLVHPGAIPAFRACPLLTLVFDMRAGSSTITEVRGPRLSVHEAIYYRGGVYSVRSVRGDTFTVDFRGRLFVNHGAAIHDARAIVLRGAVFLSGPMCKK
jgi:hypothetical protein